MQSFLQKFIFVPLDLPAISFDRNALLDYYDREKYALDSSKYHFLASLYYPWYCLHLKQNNQWNWPFMKQFPDFMVKLIALPFLKSSIGILEQRKVVMAHKDQSRDIAEHLGPSSFRCPIIFDEPDNTFYFIKDKNPRKKIAPSFPTDHSKWFAMNNYNAMHGSYMTSPGKRKLMLCVWGIVDPDRYSSLVLHSILKYRDHCITD